MADRVYVPGQAIVISFGSFGTQRAIVTRRCSDRGGRVYVRKYRANSKRWTKETWVEPDYVVEPNQTEG